MTKKKSKEQPKCPECKSEISSLIFDNFEKNLGIFSTDKSGGYDWKHGNYKVVVKKIYYCPNPNCGKKLFDNDDDAINFLTNNN